MDFVQAVSVAASPLSQGTARLRVAACWLRLARDRLNEWIEVLESEIAKRQALQIRTISGSTEGGTASRHHEQTKEEPQS